MLAMGCATRKPTPPEVLQSYETLRSELDEDAPGGSIAKLEAFRDRHAHYDISTAAARDISALRARTTGSFAKARELARQDEFPRAEKILKDLAENLPDTEDGRLARQYLKFEFRFFKAQRLLMQGRAEEAERAIRAPLAGDLTAQQVEQRERLLDAISNVKRAKAMAGAARAENACRMLQMLLNQYHAENGKFPPSLSLQDGDFPDASVRDRIREGLSAIEDYRPSEKGFSFVGIGRDGQSRIRTTESRVERQD